MVKFFVNAFLKGKLGKLNYYINRYSQVLEALNISIIFKGSVIAR
jgi:hypothetical protein